MKRRILLIVSSIVSLVFIFFGILFYFVNEDKIQGIYVRKQYGSYGGLNFQDFYMTYEVFNFNDADMSFLNTENEILCNDDNITIQDINLKLQNAENDLKVYDLIVSLKFNDNNIFNLSKLICKYQDSIIDIELGNMIFINYDFPRESFTHSTYSQFIGNDTNITFDKSNSRPFEIQEIIYDKTYIDNISYSDNRVFTPGDNLEIDIKVLFNCAEFDEFVFYPIIKIKYLDTNEIGYFITGTYTTSYKPMTYNQVKEYVK